MAVTVVNVRDAIKSVVLDGYYTDAAIDVWVDDAMQAVAGGVIMPDGDISPPLPDLYSIETVNTSTSFPYVELPDDYQRNVFYVSDSTGYRIHPVMGGDYYSFSLFMNRAIKKDLTTQGSVDSVCVRGSNLYYQGIPAASTQISVQYYRAPSGLEGIPQHLMKSILKHWVCKEIFGEGIEDGEDNSGRGQAYHEKKFYEFMETLRQFIGIDAEPEYYGFSGTEWSDW